MSRNNDVFQVLIPTLATTTAAGETLDDLAVGELGAFDYETNLAIDAPKSNYYWALKYVNEDGVNDIVKSAGTHIQGKNVVSLTNQCYVAPVEKVVQLANWTAECSKDYIVKFEIRNQEAYRLNGYNQVVKQYAAVAPDCVDCNSDCPNGDCFAVAQSLIDQVNADPDAVVVASALVPQGKLLTIIAVTVASGVATISIGALDVVTPIAIDTAVNTAIVYANAINADGTFSAIVDPADTDSVLIYGAPVGTVITIAIATATGGGATEVDFVEVALTNLLGISENENCPTLVFTVNPAIFSSFCDINLNYFFPKQTDIVLVGLSGFEGNSTVSTTTEMVYEDGSGHDIKQLEYDAGGWNGSPGPYRVSELTGTALGNFRYFADASKKYNVIHQSYDQNSVSGWRDDNHFQRTIIAIDDALNISDTIGAFVNTITAGQVDAIVVCAD